MSAIYLGIDCGTQSTKTLLIDAEQGRIIGCGRAAHSLEQNADGRREQHPHIWTDALQTALHQAVQQAGIDGRTIAAIGISGQQHGMVALDHAGCVLHPAKLWCDTQTHAENDEIIALCGGAQAAFARLGILCQTGYTASKIRWLRKHHPQTYARIAHILLPHDYLNHWLTGEYATDAGDASGTGYFDIRQRTWAHDIFALIAPELDSERVLPRIAAPADIIGTLRPAIAAQLGLAPGIPVSAGSGDNMMAALGSGNTAPGTVSMSLGTSGTLYTASNTPHDFPPDIANFCAAHGGWLPLICVMNITETVNHIRHLLQLDTAACEQQASLAPIGADGLTLLPFFNGERVPALPRAQASLHGMHAGNLNRENLCRAAYESAAFTLRYGIDLFRQSGIAVNRILLTGGGAQSALWRQMTADLMQAEVSGLKETESAALGAAIQAMWANGEDTLENLCHRHVQNDGHTTQPDPAASRAYENAYQRYRAQLMAQYGV